jgi:hypothetical protein
MGGVFGSQHRFMRRDGGGAKAGEGEVWEMNG